MSDVNVQFKIDASDAAWWADNCQAFTKQDFFNACLKMLRACVENGVLPPPGLHSTRAMLEAYASLIQKPRSET